MKGFFKHKANADLGDLTSSVLTQLVRFSSPLLLHILPLFYTQNFTYIMPLHLKQVQTPSPSEEELSHFCFN